MKIILFFRKFSFGANGPIRPVNDWSSWQWWQIWICSNFFFFFFFDFMQWRRLRDTSKLYCFSEKKLGKWLFGPILDLKMTSPLKSGSVQIFFFSFSVWKGPTSRSDLCSWFFQKKSCLGQMELIFLCKSNSASTIFLLIRQYDRYQEIHQKHTAG